VLAIGSIIWGVVSSTARKKASVAWTEFYFNLTSGDADSFAELAADHASSAAAGWARQIAGDSYLQRGIDSLYRDKAEGEKLIEQAIKEYEQVDRAARSPELRTKALLGLGQAHEALGQLDKASEYYQLLSKADAPPTVANKANERLAFLASESGRAFYDWFRELDPQPDAPITLPSDLTVPPTSPDIQFGPTGIDLPSVEGTPQVELDEGGLPPLPDVPAADAPPVDSSGSADNETAAPATTTENVLQLEP
jgi:hypothetical protein